MFVDFFLLLRAHGVPATVTEFMTLMRALDRGLSRASLDTFYHLARSVLVLLSVTQEVPKCRKQ